MRQKELLIVTGATGGFGKAIALFFARLRLKDTNVHPVLCCRNKKKAEKLKQEIELVGLDSTDYTVLLSDLSQCAGIDILIAHIKALGLPIRALVNNAGAMFKSYQTNVDEIEMNMAVNFYGPAKLAEALAQLVVPGGSIINVVSLSRKFVNIDSDFLRASPKSYSRVNNYAKSKLALTVFTKDMAERYPDLYINAVDPGIMNTNMIKMGKWFDFLTDFLFRPFTYEPSQSLEAIEAAVQKKISGYVFTRKKYFPVEKNIAQHPLKELIHTTICNDAK
ncbi:MAG TPA: SDR family NAD(P)-dependent oxidoreductase [Treponemataceae bacterium]|nr:SDR family NAD(P)-dependent oxidoreductase [Treponemataceae bacterium]